MTEPGRHRDTYVEECHRGFFAAYARGKDPARCAVKEKHIGGLASVGPIAAWYASDPASAERAALTHVSLTHAGARMTDAVRLLTRLLVEVLAGRPLVETLESAVARQDSPLLGHPFARWLSLPDAAVIGRQLSPACYVEDAVPATLYLAMKYHDQPEEAMVVNTNLGGDNVHRGAVLGALLGAEHGASGFPQRWREGLVCRELLEHWPGPVDREAAADV
jgi:ADP-ribosylglycohydrolase